MGSQLECEVRKGRTGEEGQHFEKRSNGTREKDDEGQHNTTRNEAKQSKTKDKENTKTIADKTRTGQVRSVRQVMTSEERDDNTEWQTDRTTRAFNQIGRITA